MHLTTGYIEAVDLLGVELDRSSVVCRRTKGGIRAVVRGQEASLQRERGATVIRKQICHLQYAQSGER